MNRTGLERWRELWRQLRLGGEPAAHHARLITAYAEPCRDYHNLRHIGECLGEFDAIRATVSAPALLEAAIWFHDAVYDTHSMTNEEDSAALASSCLRAAGLAAPDIETVSQLILCTKSHNPGPAADAAFLVDIDLAILGREPSRFSEYEHGIRGEYGWVPDAVYARKRGEVLGGFLARPTIYLTAHFHNRYEATARANLRQAIGLLQARAK